MKLSYCRNQRGNCAIMTGPILETPMPASDADDCGRVDPGPAVGILSASAIKRIVLIAAAVVIGLGFAREWFIASYGEFTVLQEGRHFDLDEEANLPAWFSASLMLMIGLTCGLLASHSRVRGDGLRWGWIGLAVVFVILSADEAASFHEALMEPLRAMLGADGIFFYAWIVPAIPLVGLFALIYLPFLFRLPVSTRVRFVVAGALFVGGAIGVEMIGGLFASTVGEAGTVYGVVTAIEETLEISGLSLFAVALVDYLDVTGATFAIASSSTLVTTDTAMAKTEAYRRRFESLTGRPSDRPAKAA